MTIISASCEKEKISLEADHLLPGIWTFTEYHENIMVFTRSSELINEHCYSFRDDGTLTERKNSGWCGTPPISYANFAGTWQIVNDTLINIEVGYWGGITSYKLDLEYLDPQILKFKEVYEEPDK